MIKSTPEPQPLSQLVSQGIKRAHQQLLQKKQQKETPLVVSRNGEVVEIPADEIPDFKR